MPSLISVALLVMAYVLNAQGRKFTKEGVVDPIIGAWLPILIFGPVALFLTYKAAREARILDENVWGQLREKTHGFFLRKNIKKLLGKA